MFGQIKNSFTTTSIFLAIVLMLTGCASKDKSHPDNPGTSDLFFDYQVTAEEGNDNLTVLLRYRLDDEEGDGISIREPGKIMLDGEVLQADSNKMTGIFYEVHKPIAGFSGKHSIHFTGVDGQEYREDFTFRPVGLLTVISDTMQRNDLVFDFEGLETKDNIRVLMTDTSFINNGINRVDTVINGRLTITQTDLQALANGPVQVEFIREYEKPVKKGADEGGRLLITYSLKREFVLKD